MFSKILQLKIAIEDPAQPEVVVRISDEESGWDAHIYFHAYQFDAEIRSDVQQIVDVLRENIIHHVRCGLGR